jgi:hypothetical protein
MTTETDEPLVALTFWRPWPHAILYEGKTCENRSRPPPRALLGKRIALHSGKRYGLSSWPSPAPVPTDAQSPMGIVGTARIGGWLDLRDGQRRATLEPLADSLSKIEKAACLATVFRLDEQSAWWAGPVGILLLDPRPLPTPIACKGAQGYWRVPPALAVLIRGSVCPDK